MKIALFTIHYAYNYGAMLQAFALQKYLVKHGELCDMVDYISDTQRDEYRLFKMEFSLIGILRNIRNFLTLSQQKKRQQCFDEFKERNMLLTPHVSTIEQVKGLTTNYDMLLVGSDQTWNIHLNAFDKVYLLPFQTNATKASYAASMGDNLSRFIDDELQLLAKAIKQFKYISVREATTAKFLSPYVGNEIETVVDPTILLNKDDWSHIEQQSSIDTSSLGDYILYYTVKSNREVVNYCELLSRRHNLKVICVHPQNQFETNSKFSRNIAIGPAEFISYIKNAKIVCTTSFHASVFSVIFHKKLVCPTNNMRVVNFLSNIGLEKCLKHVDKPNFDIVEADWNDVENKLNSLKEDSITYLNMILSYA